MRVTLLHRRADAIFKTGTVYAVIDTERVEVTTPLGWGMYIRPAHAQAFFLIQGEGPQYSAEDVIEMLDEAKRLQAEHCLVVMHREPPTWVPTYRHRNPDEPPVLSNPK